MLDQKEIVQGIDFKFQDSETEMSGLVASVVAALASSVLAVMGAQNSTRDPKFAAGLSTLLFALCSAGYCICLVRNKECSNKKSLEGVSAQKINEQLSTTLDEKAEETEKQRSQLADLGGELKTEAQNKAFLEMEVQTYNKDDVPGSKKDCLKIKDDVPGSKKDCLKIDRAIKTFILASKVDSDKTKGGSDYRSAKSALSSEARGGLTTKKMLDDLLRLSTTIQSDEVKTYIVDDLGKLHRSEEPNKDALGLQIQCAYFVLKNLADIESNTSQRINNESNTSQRINDLVGKNQFEDSLDRSFDKLILQAKSIDRKTSLGEIFKIIDENDVKQDKMKGSGETDAHKKDSIGPKTFGGLDLIKSKITRGKSEVKEPNTSIEQAEVQSEAHNAGQAAAA